MNKYLFLVVLTLLIQVPSARADCLPGSVGCDVQATTQAQCSDVHGTWINGQCVGATVTSPDFRTAAGLTTNTNATPGGVNQQWAIYYYNLFLWFINSILVPILIGVAFIVFLWGIFKAFIWEKESESEKMLGRKYAMWGIVAFVIITSVWGIVNIVKDTLIPSTAGSTHPSYPQL